MSEDVTFRVFRGEPDNDGDPFGEMVDYTVEMDEGMVVLDVVHKIQAEHASDLACRWNCKAGKCGSCSAEVNGIARLMCMTRMEDIMAETPNGKPVVIKPMQAFPLTKDLVTDMSWAYQMNKKMVPIKGPEGLDWEFKQEEADRIQEFRSCIECMLCVNTCHEIKDDFGLGYCNITRCCTEVCPAGINITDNAIIPLKERVVTEYYDPLALIARKLGLRE
jgi:succinate dehydrogenase / fumarate reductase iron-sulfur subunit